MNQLRIIIGYPFAILYDIITRCRNWLYDKELLSSQSFDLPIISVGNLAVGGTGKTPHVEYLIQLLAENHSPAILSRGYKRRTTGYIYASKQSTVKHIGDEALQYKIKHPTIPVAVCENRVLGVPQLLMDAPETTAILLDDAFQHRAIQPGLSIVLTDYNHLFYNDKILPAGNLRESKVGMQRADIIIVTKCPFDLDEKEAQTIRKKIRLKEHQELYFTYFHYGQPYHYLTPEQKLSKVNQEVLITTGIAKPEYLLAYAKNTYQNAFLLDYSDHHYFTERDIVAIKDTFQNLGDVNKSILITEKDAVKFLSLASTIKEFNLPIYVQPIQVGFLFNQGNSFNNKVLNFVQNFYQ